MRRIQSLSSTSRLEAEYTAAGTRRGVTGAPQTASGPGPPPPRALRTELRQLVGVREATCGERRGEESGRDAVPPGRTRRRRGERAGPHLAAGRRGRARCPPAARWRPGAAARTPGSAGTAAATAAPRRGTGPPPPPPCFRTAPRFRAPPHRARAARPALRGRRAPGRGFKGTAAAAAARQVRGAVCGGGLGAAVGKGRAGGRRGRGSGGRPAGGLLRSRSGPAALGKAASLWGLCPGSASARPSLGTCRGLV